TAPSPIETAVHLDYVATMLRGPRPVECKDQATERLTAALLMKERISRRESAFSGKSQEGITSMVLGIGFIALALAISGLSLALNFFSAPDSHLSRPPISAIEDAPQGSEPDSWAGVPPTTGDEAAAAPRVILGPVRGSLAAAPPALSDEPLVAPRAT